MLFYSGALTFPRVPESATQVCPGGICYRIFRRIRPYRNGRTFFLFVGEIYGLPVLAIVNPYR